MSARIDRPHSAAMAAKRAVFLAQDATSIAWDGATPSERKALKKIERRLAKVRSELEALDRDVLAARTHIAIAPFNTIDPLDMEDGEG